MSKTVQRLIPLAILVLACGCLTYAGGVVVGFRLGYEPTTWVPAQREPLEVFWVTWSNVERHFYGDIPPAEERTYAAIHETLTLLGDPYTVFVEPVERELERDQLRGAFGGIGVDLWRDAESQTLLYPYEDSPADRAGVLQQDVLLAVDSLTVTVDTSLDTVRAALHGEVGTAVTLTVSRPPMPAQEIVIEREQIQTPSVTWRLLPQAPEIGYISIASFTERTDEELQDAVDELESLSAIAVVLDLRGNYGGLIDSAIGVSSEFLSEGVVLYEERRDGDETALQVRSRGEATEIPLVVLVNAGTASAAEIVAGALQDHDRAPLIGVRTYGKGSVQLIFSLSDDSSLHVTSKLWLTPDRHQIQGVGLTPDIIVPLGQGTVDEQLAQAVEYINGEQADTSDLGSAAGR